MTRTPTKFYLLKNDVLVLPNATLDQAMAYISANCIPAAGEDKPNFICIAGRELALQIDMGPHVKIASRVKKTETKKKNSDGKKAAKKAAAVPAEPVPPPASA